MIHWLAFCWWQPASLDGEKPMEHGNEKSMHGSNIERDWRTTFNPSKNSARTVSCTYCCHCVKSVCAFASSNDSDSELRLWSRRSSLSIFGFSCTRATQLLTGVKPDDTKKKNFSLSSLKRSSLEITTCFHRSSPFPQVFLHV